MRFKRRIKTALCALLTAAMVLSATPYTSLAAQDETDSSEQSPVIGDESPDDTLDSDANTESYNYTIYYYDKNHTSTDSCALWIWEKDGSGATAPVYFTDYEVLSDGNTWLRANIEVNYTSVCIIPRSHDDWSWQDDTREYVNSDKNGNVTLYIVYGDDANIYTSLPEIKEAESRYLIVEYDREDGSAKDWYFYTWNNGFSGFYPFSENENGKWIAQVPVKSGLSSVSYCIEMADTSGDEISHWAQKDGADYICSMPVDQSAVKIIMTQDNGITYTYPYNTGYELVPGEKKIHFYYRDDEAFISGDEGGYESVSVEINGALYQMEYDSLTQRYVFDLENIETGSYRYRYILDGNYVIDKFNENTCLIDEIEYSICDYSAFDAVIGASLQNDSMDYNDNNVLSVTLSSDGLVVSSAYADLSELGGGVTPIEPEIMQLSISVKEGTGTGEKTIPIVVYDQYNNEYTTDVTVNVVDREKGDDFDWDEAVIYFTVTDRFFDGNASNNGEGYDTDSETGSLSYHGGDFAGLTKKLDYLESLGVNTIWITPIVANDMEEGLSTSLDNVKSWGYHGYWASDFTKLDSHLGTKEEFAALVDAVHAHGMKIMVDVVLNHAGYNTEDYFNNIIENIAMIRDDDQTVNGSDQKSSLSGLPDFVTENEQVRELLVMWQSQWVKDYDIDYYRVDTVKHVDDATWTAFKNALTLINPDFKMIGEWSGAGYGNISDLLNKGRMDSLLDFDFNDKAVSFVTGDISGTEDFLNKRNTSIDNTASLGAFIGSHDEDGLVYKLINSENIETERAKRLQKAAAALQLTVKGQIVIYYGEEIGLYGADNYPYQTNRYDFDWSIANDDNDMLLHYKKLLSIRSDYSEVLAKGTRTTIEASDEKGIDIFQRSYDNTTLTIGININDYSYDYEITGLKADTAYTDLYGKRTYMTDKNGAVTVTIPAVADGSVIVLSEGKKTDSTPDNSVSSDDTDNNNWQEPNEPSDEVITIPDTIPVTPVEPSFVNKDGVMISGWNNIINEEINGNKTQAFPIIDITLDINNVKPIPHETVKIMADSNSTFRFHSNLGQVIVFSPKALKNTDGDIDLSADIKTYSDFGQGFKAFIMSPKTKSAYSAVLAQAFYLGDSSANKPAYIFKNDIKTGQTKLLSATFITAEGTITVTDCDYTDIIILY